MATNPNKVAKVVTMTDAQVDTLANGGSITKGGNTYTADENTMYLTEDQPVVLIGSTDPTTATVGYVGQFYLNATTPKLFQCTAITSGTPNTYTWSEVGGVTVDQVYNASSTNAQSGVAVASAISSAITTALNTPV